MKKIEGLLTRQFESMTTGFTSSELNANRVKSSWSLTPKSLHQLRLPRLRNEFLYGRVFEYPLSIAVSVDESGKIWLLYKMVHSHILGGVLW